MKLDSTQIQIKCRLFDEVPPPSSLLKARTKALIFPPQLLPLDPRSWKPELPVS